MTGWSKILCAVDFSPGARLALDEAAALARRLDASLTLFHVHAAPSPSPAMLVASPGRYERIAAELGRELDAWRREAERLACRGVRAVLASGDPAAEIVRAACEGGFDLVVTGSARNGRAARGSVAESVVRRAPCPVLVARPVLDLAA